MRRAKRRSTKNGRNGKIGQREDGLLTIKEFCEWAGISESQYYVQRRNGRMPPEIRIAPRLIRIALTEAQAWAARLTNKD